ncbi:MAG: hypothetical protein Alpg2KO_03060 [Alphaproteobacteria bacterium]
MFIGGIYMLNRAIPQFIDRLIGKPAPVTTADELEMFIARQSAFISQKCTVEYCRARAGLNWDKLFKEQTFIEAMEICRWEALGAITVDMVDVVWDRLRPHVTADLMEDVSTGLCRIGQSVLYHHKVPEWRQERWQPEADQIEQNMKSASIRVARTVPETTARSARLVFEHLPIHPELRKHDTELITNNIAFNAIRAAEDLDLSADWPNLVRHLAGATNGKG